jgi:hypothetical protein
LFKVDNLHSLLLHNVANPKKQQSIHNVLQQCTIFKLLQRAQHVDSEAIRVLQYQKICDLVLSVSGAGKYDDALN